MIKKNIKNVAGCRDTRTAKSKETRGMIEHNSEQFLPRAVGGNGPGYEAN